MQKSSEHRGPVTPEPAVVTIRTPWPLTALWKTSGEFSIPESKGGFSSGEEIGVYVTVSSLYLETRNRLILMEPSRSTRFYLVNLPGVWDQVFAQLVLAV